MVKTSKIRFDILAKRTAITSIEAKSYEEALKNARKLYGNDVTIRYQLRVVKV